jgi:hypothetical protein
MIYGPVDHLDKTRTPESLPKTDRECHAEIHLPPQLLPRTLFWPVSVKELSQCLVGLAPVGWANIGGDV